LPAMQAAVAGIDYLARRVNGLGGVIGIDKAGHYAYAFNTPRMARAMVIDGEILTAIEP